jgi:hypothetical protein
MKRLMTITMPDGSKWGVPVDMIARDRAKHYAHEFGGDVERSQIGRASCRERVS